jgi:hypothetical protein
MSIVGENARERKCDRGYQYQNWRNISTPTAPLCKRGGRGRGREWKGKKMSKQS